MTERIFIQSFMKSTKKGFKASPFPVGRGLSSINLNVRNKLIKIIPNDLIGFITPNLPPEQLFTLPENKLITIVDPHGDDTAWCMGELASKLAIKNGITILIPFSDHTGVLGSESIEVKKKLREDETSKYAFEIGMETHPLVMEFPFHGAELVWQPNAPSLNHEETIFGDPREDDFRIFARTLSELDPDIIFIPHPLDRNQLHRFATGLVLHSIDDLAKSASSNFKIFFYETFDNFDKFGVSANLFNFFKTDKAAEKYNLIYRCFKTQIKRRKGFDMSKISDAAKGRKNKKEMNLRIPETCCERYQEVKIKTLRI